MRSLDLFSHQYQINKTIWAYNPRGAFEPQLSVLTQKLLQASKSEVSIFDLMIPRAEAHPALYRQSVIIHPRVKGDTALQDAIKARNAWISEMRDQANDEPFLDKDAEKSDDLKKKETWMQYATVVSIMDKLMAAACNPLAKKELEDPSKTKSIQ